MLTSTLLASSALMLASVNCAALTFIHGAHPDKVKSVKRSDRVYVNGVSLTASTYQCFDDKSQHSLEPSAWLAFDDMWRVNEPTILSANGGNTYLTHYVHEGIVEVAEETGVDSRLILAIVMQKSNGDVNVPCRSTLSGHTRCGLMRVINGRSFDESNISSSVTDMIREGVQSGDSHPVYDKEVKYMSDVANRLLGWNGRGAGYQSCLARHANRKKKFFW